MNKEQLKKQIFSDIDSNRDYYVNYLMNMVRVPAEVFKTTYAQELVKTTMEEDGFSLDCFPCGTEEFKDLSDFHAYPENLEQRDDVENVVGVIKGTKAGSGKDLMLIAHIDTAAVSDLTPDFSVKVEDGLMKGLGVGDSKGGVAMMLLGARAVLDQHKDLEGSLTMLSSIGKRGAIGTLTAMKRGYSADVGVYLHPAETGHGFHEIKNFSMGMLDIHIVVKGKSGKIFDELDYSEISAVYEGMKVVDALRKLDAERQTKHVFSDGEMKGKSFTKMEMFGFVSSDFYMNDVRRVDIDVRINFGDDESVDDVFEEVKAYLTESLKDSEWLSANPPEVTKGVFKGSPVCVSPESDVIKLVEGAITEVKDFDDFIYQYHGSSEVRLPNLYGNTPTVGIGPLCYNLGSLEKVEALDVDDYIAGIKIVAALIVDWCC